MKVLDHGYCNYIEHWGSDIRVIEAARMSTNKGFLGWENDQRLLSYLWKNKHYTPFEMAGLVVEIQAPIFVFREWHRHRTQSYNELSSRYTQLPDLYYVPSVERIMNGAQARGNKQSSEGGIPEESARGIQQAISAEYVRARAEYESLLASGLSRELARVIVPVGQYSRMRASANLRNWLGFLSLRLDSGAQWEIREYAKAVAKIIAEYFPRTHMLFWEGYEQEAGRG